MFYEAEMIPANVFTSPSDDEYQKENRRWQGIASIERTVGGRLFSVFYSGGTGEGNGNFIVLAQSDDDGKSWREPVLIIRHPDAQMRVFDPGVWTDPLGRLWITWAQSHDYFDGRDGVWAIVCTTPDAGELSFTAPRRLANGVMMNKPTVLADGTWLLPCAVWVCRKPTEEHPEVANERLSNVYASTDNGKTFVLRGGADVPNRSFDEHMVVERRDGSLWMLVRRHDGVGQAFSYDQGCTWWQQGHAGIPGPDSRFFIRRLQSGNLLLVNHVEYHGRNNLMAKLSFDDGKTWVGGLMLDERKNVSYPDGTQAPDGRIYIAYDHERCRDREVLMAVFTEADILAGKCVSNGTRLRVLISQATGELPTQEAHLIEKKELLRKVAPCSLLCHTCTACEHGAIRCLSEELLHYMDGLSEFNEKHAVPWAEAHRSFIQGLENYAGGRCTGCRSGADRKGCIRGCFLPECVKEHGVDFCGECGEFPCAKTRDLFEEEVYAQWLQGSRRIRETGAQAFWEERREVPHYRAYKKNAP